ncbi:MAG: peptidyl-prolyl cis-trans isomerase, partial [Gammaproteobacteria bacterium]|nr:peptidyl-prolyl cis-trans isomerase [Gammaproteobacteria bacterium]
EEEVFESAQNDSQQVNLARIEISDNLERALTEEFTWLSGRAPTPEEAAELVDEWLQEEMIFRHTLLTGQHLNDGKVREHMIEKVSLLWAGLPDDPSDAQMLQHYMDNIDYYYSEPKASFAQVFFNQLPENSDEILARLNAGEEITGDVYWLGSLIEGYAESVLRANFGGEFYETVASAEQQRWIGPLSSPRGYHFINISEVTPALPLKFEDIYLRVRQSWLDAEQRRLISEQVDQLRPQFDVVHIGEDADGTEVALNDH